MPLRLAGSWTGGDGDDSRWMGVQGSSGNLDGLLWLVRERVELIRPDVYNSKNRIKVSKKGLRSSRKDPDYWTGYLRNTRLFPDHPAVKYLDEYDYDAMLDYKESDIQDWYDQLYQPSNAVLFVVGRISDMAEAERLVQHYLGSWQPSDATGDTFKGYELPAAPAPPDRQVLVLDKQRVSQTSMSLACQVGPASLENLEAREVLADVLDEMAWTRLRETAGVTYGAGAGQWEYPGGAAALYFGSL
ncbi:MAG: insulinase family protein, partial [Proteobacteria bacterium]|nr:insulinase family protein [Pseudomonadota bacterium]